MHTVTVTTHSARETQRFARQFTKALQSVFPFGSAVVCALDGNLGSGKTTFVQGMARALGIPQAMTSPTFLLMRSFTVSGKGFRTFIHVDSWRIDSNDLVHLGVQDALCNPRILVCIEWAKRVKTILPRDTIWLTFVHRSPTTRTITIRIP